MNIETRALTRWISEREFYRVDERNDKKIFQLSTNTGFSPSKRIGCAYKSSIVQILKTHLNPLARSTIMLHNNWHSIRNMWPFTATHLLAAILDVATQPCTIMLSTAEAYEKHQASSSDSKSSHHKRDNKKTSRVLRSRNKDTPMRMYGCMC